MTATVKGASLLPADFTSGGAVADGEYSIEAAITQMFNYGGAAPDTPTLCITYKGTDGALIDQNYSAGKSDSLIPSEDGKRFVHPSGEEAHINKSSNAAAWLGSIINSGFPVARMSDDVSCFVGTRVQVVNSAQPKRPGLKDHVEGKTIPLVVKVVALPGEGKKGTASARSAASTSGSTATAAAAAASPSNGAAVNLDEAAISAIQEVLAEAPENKLTRLKLATGVMLKLTKTKDPNMAQIKKLASTPEFLAANAEAGGWVSDGETVSLQS